MSIFGKIKSAIFGENGGPLSDSYLGGNSPAPTPEPAPAAASAEPTPIAVAPVQPEVPTPAAAAPQSAEQRLSDLAAFKGNPDLNYKSSIVDLMKLLDLDPSLTNRKELARELGYAGATDGSAEMNIWLHQAVMKQLGADSPS